MSCARRGQRAMAPASSSSNYVLRCGRELRRVQPYAAGGKSSGAARVAGFHIHAVILSGAKLGRFEETAGPETQPPAGDLDP
jgi:hypothetical protein